MLSNIFYFNLLDEYLHKAFPNIPLKQIKKTPIEFKIILLRLLDVHHKDHNKKNYHISNLQLVSKQENNREYEKYRKKAVSRK
jgi:hypothetical protein